MLSDYYKRYQCDGLPPLESRFSKTLTAIYREEHPSIHEIFERCFVEDETSAVGAKRVFAVMQCNGYDDNQKKLKLFLEERYKNHNSVKKTMPKNVLTWKGLRVLDDVG